MEPILAMLGHDDPSRRHEARQALVARGADALPGVEAALREEQSPVSPRAQELARVRDWITWGEDPEKLKSWLGELDLRHLDHGNLFGGHAGAIGHQPAFRRLCELGTRAHRFLEEVVADPRAAYHLRAAAVQVLGESGGGEQAGVLVLALAGEHAQLAASGEEMVKVEERYRGFFVHALAEALAGVTGERFVAGIYQYVFEAVPQAFAFPGTLGTAAAAWQRWCAWRAAGYAGPEADPRERARGLVAELAGAEGRDCESLLFALNPLGPDGDEEIAQYLARLAAMDGAALRFAEMLIRNGRGAALRGGPCTAELIAGVLLEIGDLPVVRTMIERAFAALPADTIRALGVVVSRHPLAGEHAGLFDPLHWSSIGEFSIPDAALADDAVDAITAGLQSPDPRARDFYVGMARGALPSVAGERPAKARAIADTLSALAADERDPSRRTDLLALIHAGGGMLDADTVYGLIDWASDAEDYGALEVLLKLAAGVQAAPEAREEQVEVLERTLVRVPGSALLVLHCLSKLDGEVFDSGPGIGADAALALVEFRRAVRSEDPSGPARAADALRAFREGLVPAGRGEPIDTMFAASALQHAITLATRYDLPRALLESVIHCARMLTLSPSVGYHGPDPDAGSEAPQTPREMLEMGFPAGFLYGSAYLRQVEGEETLSSYDLSAALFERAAEMSRHLGLGDALRLSLLVGAADMIRRAGRHRTAESYFCDLAAEVEPHPASARALWLCRTELLLRQRRWTEALEAAQSFRALCEGAGEPLSPYDEHALLVSDLNEAIARRRRGEYAAAEALHLSLLKAFDERDDVANLARVIAEALATCVERGDWDGVEWFLEEGPRIVEGRRGAEAARADTLRHAAVLRLERGDPVVAAGLLREALAIREAMPYMERLVFEEEAEDWMLLGRALLSIGDFAGAAAAAAHLGGFTSPLSAALHARLEAALQSASGSPAAAAATLSDALTMLEPPFHPDVRVEISLDLHRLLQAQGFSAEALAALAGAMETARASRDPRAIGRVELALARAQVLDGRLEEAREIYRSILDAGTEFTPARLVANVWLCMTGAGEGYVPGADELAGEAAAIPEAAVRADTLLHLARFYLSRGQVPEAAHVLDRITASLHGESSLEVLTQVEMVRGRLARAMGRADDAVGHFRRAVHVAEVIHAATRASGLGTGFVGADDAPYAALVEALVDAGRPGEALHIVERARARLFLGQMHWRAMAEPNAGGAVARYLQGLQRLAFLELAGGRDGAAPVSAERRALEAELEALRREIPERELLEAVHPALEEPADTLRALGEVLRGGTNPAAADAAPRVVLAEYFVTAEATWLFLLRDGMPEPRAVRIGRTGPELRAFAAAHFRGGEGQGVRVLRMDEGAFHALLAPLVAPIIGGDGGGPVAAEGDVVWIIPHGPLHALPLHAVAVGGRTLIERNPVCVTPSAAVLCRPGAVRPGGSGAVLVVGDPGGDLPHAREEAASVAELFGTAPLMGAQATRSAVAERLRDGGGFGTLHFSTHGFFDPASPMRSGVRLAPAAGDDGVLTAGQLFDLQLGPALVTVSACESGVSEERPGDERVGLTRALLHAGAVAVVATLWSVADVSAALLMRRFYEFLRGAPAISRAEALRRAQLYVRGLTAREAVDYCDARLRALGADDEDRWLRLRLDRTGLVAVAGDLDAAIAAYGELLPALRARGAAWASTAEHVGRLVPVLELKRGLGSIPSYDVRPYAAPYHWAAFTLVGGWS